jgi:hypothetical protein
MDWGIEDLVAAAVLIGAGGLGLWLAGRWFTGWRFWVAVLVVAAAVALVWADLAVGVFR